MKTQSFLFILACFFGINQTLQAQDHDPFLDYQDLQLSNTATVPDFESKTEKLKVSGIIYESDGVTPAKDIILYIEQADEYGDFDVRKKNDAKYVHHRAWVKTDADGRYTFYTFVPGNDRRYNQKQMLIPVIKEPSKPAYQIASFLFNDDPMLSKLCRKRMAKKGDPTRILQPKMVDGILVAQKNIVLDDTAVVSQ